MIIGPGRRVAKTSWPKQRKKQREMRIFSRLILISRAWSEARDEYYSRGTCLQSILHKITELSTKLQIFSENVFSAWSCFTTFQISNTENHVRERAASVSFAKYLEVTRAERRQTPSTAVSNDHTIGCQTSDSAIVQNFTTWPCLWC